MVLNIVGRDDIALYCPFNEGSGSTAYDYSENSNNGTLTNSPNYIKIKNGAYAINFTGSNYVDIDSLSSSLNPNADYTILFWARTSYTGGTQTFFSMGNTGRGDSFINFELESDGDMVFKTQGSSGEINNTITGDYNDGKWHFYAGTRIYSPTQTLNLYIDGTTSKTVTGSIVDFTINAGAIGLLQRNSQVNFTRGDIDFVTVFTKALSQEEIRAIYRATYRS